MAPDLRNYTTLDSYGYFPWKISVHGPYKVYYTGSNTYESYESYEYANSTSSEIYWSHRDKYDTSYTENLVYPTKQIEKNVKKLLKKMANEMCKIGWLYYLPNYFQPKLQPISLRGVRLDGRGWANL